MQHNTLHTLFLRQSQARVERAGGLTQVPLTSMNLWVQTPVPLKKRKKERKKRKGKELLNRMKRKVREITLIAGKAGFKSN
jgi:hypothetical protein